jgi:uncharacterized membrane protein YdfJ with MMPL/SSD domain
MRTVRERTCCEEEEDAFATEQQDRNATQTRRTVANRDFMVIVIIVIVVVVDIVDIVIMKVVIPIDTVNSWLKVQ